jgi:nucleoid DNA-binding protein
MIKQNKEKYCMATKTKKQLITKIAAQTNHHPNEVRLIVQAFLDSITDCLSEGNRLEFRDFGVFEVVTRKQKIGRNPKNASIAIVIPERQAVKFTAGKKMRMVVESEASAMV